METNSPREPLLLKMAQVAELLQISRSQAYALATAGALPGVVRIGGAVRVSRAALLRWLEVQEAASPQGSRR